MTTMRSLHTCQVCMLVLCTLAMVAAERGDWMGLRGDPATKNYNSLPETSGEWEMPLGSGWVLTPAHGSFQYRGKGFHGVLLYHNTTQEVRMVVLSCNGTGTVFDGNLNMTVSPKGVDGPVWPSLAAAGANLVVCGASLNESRSLCRLFKLPSVVPTNEVAFDGARISTVASDADKHHSSSYTVFEVVAGTNVHYMQAEDDDDSGLLLEMSRQIVEEEQHWDELMRGGGFEFIKYFSEPADQWIGSVISAGSMRGKVPLNARYSQSFRSESFVRCDDPAIHNWRLVQCNVMVVVDPTFIQGCLGVVDRDGHLSGSSCPFTAPIKSIMSDQPLLFTEKAVVNAEDDDDFWRAPYVDRSSEVPLSCIVYGKSWVVYVDGDTIMARDKRSGRSMWKRELAANVNPVALWCVEDAVLVTSQEEQPVFYSYSFGMDYDYYYYYYYYYF